jgi:hypothetical protein
VLRVVVSIDMVAAVKTDLARLVGQRRRLSERLLRRRWAERIAERHAVDAGDVEHVLFNLMLLPSERLRRSFQRGRLGRIAAK